MSCFEPLFLRSTGLGPVSSPPDRSHRPAVDDRPREVDLVGSAKPVQQDAMDLLPHAGGVPVAQTSPARHARAAAHLLGEMLPRDPGLEHEENPGQRSPGRHRLAAGIQEPARLGKRQERLDQFPKVIVQQRFRHGYTCLFIHDFGDSATIT